METLNIKTRVAKLLLPPSRRSMDEFRVDPEGCVCAYAKYCTSDGRCLLQPMLNDPYTLEPRAEVLPGNYEIAPPPGEHFIDLQEDQDVESDVIDRLPRG